MLRKPVRDRVLVGLDAPARDAAISGVVSVEGWAIAAGRVRAVEVLVDGKRLGWAAYGAERPDVLAAFPQLAMTARCGFRYSLDCYRLGDGKHMLTVSARSTRRGQAEMSQEIMVGNRAGVPDSCPLCGSKRVNRRPAWLAGRYRYHICRACDVGFIYPIPTAEECQVYYDSAYVTPERAREIVREEPVRWDAAELHQLIARYHPTAHRVCDAGCGTGTLINGLAKYGYAVVGYELSQVSSAVAREELGLSVVTGTLADAVGARFDVVIMRHMLEHSPTPLAELADAVKVLAEHGILLVVMPNRRSFPARLYRGAWQWFVVPAHIWHFSWRTLSWAAAHSRLKPLHHYTRKGDALLLAHEWLEIVAALRAGNSRKQAAARRITPFYLPLAGLLQRVAPRLGRGQEVVAVFAKGAPGKR